MLKKQKKSSEEISAEEFFPVEEDYKRKTEKSVKELTPDKPRRSTEKQVKTSPEVEHVEKVGKKNYKRKRKSSKKKKENPLLKEL